MVEEGVLETKITELKEAFYFLSDTITKSSESAKLIPEISVNLKDLRNGMEQLLASTGKLPESKKDDLMQKINDLNTTLEFLKGNEGSFTSLIDTNTKLIKEISSLKENVEEIKKSSNQKIEEHLQEVTEKIRGIQEYSENLKNVVEKLNHIGTQFNIQPETHTYNENSSEENNSLKTLLIEIKEKLDSLQEIKNSLDNLTKGIGKDHEQMFAKLESIKTDSEPVDPSIINSGNITEKHSIIIEKLDEIKQTQQETDLPGLKTALETLATQISKLSQVEIQTEVQSISKLHETTATLLQDLKNANFDPTKFDLNNTQVLELLKQKFDITGQALKIIYDKQKQLEDKIQEHANQPAPIQPQSVIESNSEMLDQIIGKVSELKQAISQQKTMLEIATQKPEKTDDKGISVALTAMASSFDQMTKDAKNDSTQTQEIVAKMKNEIEVNNAKMIIALEQVKNASEIQKSSQEHENNLNNSIERLEKHYEQTNLILGQINKSNQEVQNNFNTKLELLNNTIQSSFKTLESDAKLQKTSTDTLIQILIKISENIDAVNKKLH